MKFSTYQTDIFSFIAHEAGNLVVNAKAGSGKTTTIIESLKSLPKKSRSILMAFNKAIATELSRKVPANVTACTYHSAGFRAYKSMMGRQSVKVDNRKTYNILNDMNNVGFITDKEYSDIAVFASKLVGHAKSAGIGVVEGSDIRANWVEIVNHFGLTLESEVDFDRALYIAHEAFVASINLKNIIDFDDMIFMPLVHHASFTTYDFIFVDEAQDTNKIQTLMVEAMSGAKTRSIFVGDPNQAIYGFRGADSSAIDNIVSKFNCTVLPLSVSYRCASKIIDSAKMFCPDIEAFEHAQEGIVSECEGYSSSNFQKGDAILCRNNAPLVSKAYELIREGISISFTGRDLGAGLKSLIKRLNKSGRLSVNGLVEKLTKWRDNQIKKLIQNEQTHLIQSVEDKIDCLNVFINNLPEDDHTVSRLVMDIENLFRGSKHAKVTLSTIHSSKGKEWERVFILDSHLMPSKWASKEWELVQEDNLHYVAITRAKTELTYIYSPE